MDEERPIPLKDLAEVESPEVVRAALRWFRRRTFWRVATIIAMVLLTPAALRGWNADREPPSEAATLEAAETKDVGAVIRGKRSTLLLLEVRDLTDFKRIHPGGGMWAPNSTSPHELKVAAWSRDLKPNEILSVTTDPITGGGGEERYRGPAIRTAEAWLPFEPNQTYPLRVRVLALTGLDGGEKYPGSHDRSQCAVPLNPLGVCEFTKREGRQIEVITIDVKDLPLPSHD